MWYLKPDTFVLLAAFSILAAGIWRVLPGRAARLLLPVIQSAALCYISPKLAAFFALYTAASLLMALLLSKCRRAPLFAFFCLLAVIPFVFSRTYFFGVSLPGALAIGLAFHVLRVIDVFCHAYYGGQAPRPLAFANYMLFLPVFTAGPIFRYRDFLRTYDAPLPATSALFGGAFRRIIRGLFKKVVLAETGMLVLSFTAAAEPIWYLSVLAVVLSYAILYLDLSGYTDVAVAFGRIAGMDVPENFKKPLLAASFTQFWRSWHATLSDWIREHMYVLLAKRKLGRFGAGLVALITMVAMSLWHGFSPLFFLAGVFNGVLLMLENFFRLTTVKRNTSRTAYALRCAFVNFAFGLNTLVFTLEPARIESVLTGFLRF
jgi:alginate O-acetyltransferase complex protein AlgI